MKRKTCLIITLSLILMALIPISQVLAQAEVKEGYIPYVAGKAAARYKSFDSSNDKEIYLGLGDVPPGSRVESDITWQTSNHIKFWYVPGDGKVYTEVTAGAQTKNLEYTVGDLGVLNYFEFLLVKRNVDTTSVVRFENVTLNSEDLGDFEAVLDEWKHWYVTGIDLTAGFVLEGDLILDGDQPRGEYSKLQVTAGYVQPLDEPIIDDGPIEADSYEAAARYLHFGGPRNENAGVYLGSTPELASPSERVAANVDWDSPSTSHVKFWYIPANNKIYTEVDTPIEVQYLEYDVDVQCDLNYAEIQIVNRQDDTTVDFNDVTLNMTPLGSFSGPANSGWNTWYMFGFDISGGFLFEGDIVLTGDQPKREKNKVQITVGCVNPPTDILLSDDTIPENNAVGDPVGTLSTVDADVADTFTYTLVAGDGDENNDSFTISGDQLLAAESFNYEVKDTYTVRIRTTDSKGLFYEQSFVITVLDVNDPPVAFPQTVNVEYRVPVPITLEGFDEDGDPLEFSLVTLPDFGELVGIPPNLLYIPDGYFKGTDQFIFIVNDGELTSTGAVVDLTNDVKLTLDYFIPLFMQYP